MFISCLILPDKPVFFPVILEAPYVVTTFGFVQGSSRSFMVSHTLKNKSFPVVVPCIKTS
jgi:hypothetical protein